MKKRFIPLDLQFFANDGEDGNGQGSQDQQGAQGAAGADNNASTGNDNSTNQNNGSDNSGKDEKVFTQHQVTAMMSKEKKQGKASAYNELGIDPNDTKTIAMIKAFVEANKTDEQKSNEESAKQQAKIAEAERRAVMAESKAAAMQFGVNPEYVDDCITVALSKVTDTKDLETVLGELKEKYPVWFNVASDNNVGNKGTGTTVGKAGSTGGSSNNYSGMGKKLAEARRSSNATNKDGGFWGK